ncbi:MAG: GDP-mannose 4,6-dehydratase [Nanoarchaeota archaeon]
MASSFWAGRKVLVTGATGLLGSWLTKKLVDEKAEVTILQRDHPQFSELFLSGAAAKVNVARGQLESYYDIERVLNEYEIQFCFHLGAQAIVTTANRSPMSTFKSNVEGTWNVLEAARHHSLIQGVIVASSDKAYGSHDKLPYSEDAALQADHPYDVSKSCADLIAQSYHRTYGLPVGITRCGNFYGGGDLNFSRIVPGTIRSILKGEDVVIRSDGTFIRDYFYIKDAVKAYLLLAENLHRKDVVGQAFNFGTEKPNTVLEVVDQVIQTSGKKQVKKKILNQASNEIKAQYLSCAKARKFLNWKHDYDLAKGLKETYAWYQRYFSTEA